MTSFARRPIVDRARSRAISRFAWTLAMAVPVFTIAATPRTAAADDKQVCVAASEKGQQLRSEVLASLPSVVPGAKDRKGRDIVDARLTVDGKVVTENLDGKPIVLDPGVHAFVFEAKGAAAVKEQVVVKPGEKNRIVSVTIARGDDGAVAAGPVTGTTEPAQDAPKSSPPIAAYVIGGLGVVALGAAGVMGLLANSDARDLRDTCAPNCKQADVDSIQTRYTIGGVTAGVGGALLITGIVLFFVHGKEGRLGERLLCPRASAPTGRRRLRRATSLLT